MIKIISVEGGIGVGKSTLMNELKKQKQNFCYIDEPVAQWEATGLLQAMYNDSINKGCFQIAAMTTRFAPLLKAIQDGHEIIVTERCVWSDHEVFTKENLKEGSNELKAYEMAYIALLSLLPPYALYVVYLHADVDVLLKRVKHRGRPAEQMRSLEEEKTMRAYLDRLQARHDAFFYSERITCAYHVEADACSEDVFKGVVSKLDEWVPPTVAH